jgi:hypothetical protein
VIQERYGDTCIDENQRHARQNWPVSKTEIFRTSGLKEGFRAISNVAQLLQRPKILHHDRKKF